MMARSHFSALLEGKVDFLEKKEKKEIHFDGPIRDEFHGYIVALIVIARCSVTMA